MRVLTQTFEYLHMHTWLTGFWTLVFWLQNLHSLLSQATKRMVKRLMSTFWKHLDFFVLEKISKNMWRVIPENRYRTCSVDSQKQNEGQQVVVSKFLLSAKNFLRANMCIFQRNSDTHINGTKQADWVTCLDGMSTKCRHETEVPLAPKSKRLFGVKMYIWDCLIRHHILASDFTSTKFLRKGQGLSEQLQN